jgi:ABC-type bacteriocin/lantibiotic exporter with double-glycine peptidase domain
MGQGPRRRWRQVDRCQVQVLGCRNEFRGASSRELVLVRQRWGNDCGPAALATVAAYHGSPLDYDDFSNRIALDRNGTNLLALSRIAERLGFRAEGVRASYDAIPKCTLPAIAHIRSGVGGRHFVVVYRWTSAHVVLADPAVGLRKLSRRTFCRRSTGYLLIIRPPPTPSVRAAASSTQAIMARWSRRSTSNF